MDTFVELDGALQPATDLPMPLFVPTARDWEDYKGIILDFYWKQNMSMDKVLVEMKQRYGFNATRRMCISRLHKWEVRKKSNAEAKAWLLDRLQNDLMVGGDTSYLTYDSASKLLRHCRDKRVDVGPAVFLLLRSVEAPQDGNDDENPGSSPQSTPSLTLRDLELDDDRGLNESAFDANENAFFELGGSYDDIAAEAFGQPSYSDNMLLPGEAKVLLDVGDPSRPLPNSETKPGPLPHRLPPSLYNHFAQLAGDQYAVPPGIPRVPVFTGEAVAFEELLFECNSYFTGRVEQYLLNNGVSASIHATSKKFWTTLKNAIYFFKNGEDALAIPLLRATSPQTVEICKSQPLSLLREVLTTLSFINTSINPSLRPLILELFTRLTYDTSRPPEHQGPLHNICVTLQQSWMCDDVLSTVACTLARTAENILLPLDPRHAVLIRDEAFELRRACIQLLRRRKDFANAMRMATLARHNLQVRWSVDPDSVAVRLLVSQMAYLLADQGSHEKALLLTEEVVERARRCERPTAAVAGGFPCSTRAMYEMEDVAEMCVRTGKVREAVMWLRCALKGALRLCEDSQVAVHINGKLEGLYSVLEGVRTDTSVAAAAAAAG